MGLEFKNVYHAYERNQVVHNVSFHASKGEITCLLGPSGCGKTTLLQIAAGILDLQKGEICLNGKRLAGSGYNPPPEDRSIGLVFQDGALFPHLNVEKNIGFGIRDKTLRKKRVHDLLEKIGMAGFEKRFPHTLSGGQQQRVAFARAIAPSPSLLLLDEPFANVDIQLRKNLRALVRSILKREGCAAIMVTHDPNEALDVADKIVVLNTGRVVQSGSAEDLYDFPISADIECLLGGGQICKATLTATHLETAFGKWPHSVIAERQSKDTAPNIGAVEVGIRAQNLTLKAAKSDLKVQDVTCIGSHLKITVGTSDSSDILFAHLPRNSKIRIGDTVKITPTPHSVFVFPNSNQ